MKTREQKRNNKRTEIERFDWCMKRIQTHLGFGWLSERAGKQTSCPKNFLEISLTSYCNTIGQSNNAFSILGFLWRENEEAMFWSFHPLADETKNEHLPKPFFKVIRKSLQLVPAITTLSLKLVVEWRRLPRFPAKMKLLHARLHARAPLTTEKISYS